jgi:hypothetical protein
MTNSLKMIMEQENDPNLILTPRINEFMMVKKDKFTKEAMERVWSELTKPGRDRSNSFSASSAGTCLRRQELGFLGKPQKPYFPNLQEVFSEGTWMHAMWQARLLSAGLIEDIEVPLEWPKYTSKGSADGKGFVHWETANPKWRNREFILELKTVGAFAWQKKADGGPSEEHLDQMHRYMLVSGIDLYVYIIIDKGNTSGLGWKEFVNEADPERLEKSKQELEELNEALRTKTLHPLLPGCKVGQGTEYKQCPFGGKDGPCKTTKHWG